MCTYYNTSPLVRRKFDAVNILVFNTFSACEVTCEKEHFNEFEATVYILNVKFNMSGKWKIGHSDFSKKTALIQY